MIFVRYDDAKNMLNASNWSYGLMCGIKETSRTKVTILHVTYSKNGGNLGLVLKR